MAENQHIYAAIDLKSFYASVECVSRKLDTLTTNLVVADVTRSEKTICLAVSPSLKACGIPGRPRLFEVVQKVREVNRQRLADAVRAHKAVRGADGKWSFASSSFDAAALQKDLSLELGYIVAPPRMATYIEYSTRIYQIYLKYVAPEDIHVYSIDEVFIDLTHYLPFYRMTAHELVTTMIREILYTTGITATAGIGTNLYLAKAAMDIVAKHVPADKDGVRIAELDEQTYRQTLWGHTPLTDFWRVGRGYERRLQKLGLNTMGDIALCSCGGPREYYNEDLLYKTFGVNAELLIDHAWGWEPTTIADIKAYKPESSSLGSGQVLTAAYPYEKARLVVALYAGHPLAQRQQLRRQELRGETILYMSPDAADDSYGDAFFMQLYNEAGYKPNILFRSADTESILMMVSAEEGISILPAYCVEKLYNADNLVFIPLIGEGEVEEIIAAWQTTNPNPALARFLAMTPPQWE